MKYKTRYLKTRFEPETEFEVPAEPVTPFRDTLAKDLEQLKTRLLREKLANAPQVDLNVRLRRAANEAAALVWLLPEPLLLFPELFAEKAKVAVIQTERQRSIHARSRSLLAEAA